MKIDKRIWKTGALAVAVTIVWAIIVFRAADWSKALDGDFLVYGQTAGTGGTVGGTGTTGGTTVTVTKVIPQVAAGSFDGNLTKYTTVAEIVNTGATALTVSGNFYKQDGTASTIPFTTNLSSLASFTGSFSGASLPAGGILVLTTGSVTSGSIGWGRIVTTGGVSIASLFEIRDVSTGILYSRVGVQASAADMSSFVIPRLSNVASQLDVAFALVNTGAASANVTATLKDVNGQTLATRVLSLAALNQTAKFAREFFTLTNEPSATSYSYMVFDSTSPQFAAIALAFEGATQTSFPVDRLR